jgi:hypothetical protein
MHLASSWGATVAFAGVHVFQALPAVRIAPPEFFLDEHVESIHHHGTAR